MRKYNDDFPQEQQKWPNFRVVVPTEDDKKELLEASEHIHGSNIDTDYMYVNSIAHMYYVPNYHIIVDKKLYEKMENEYPRDNKNIDDMYREEHG